MLGGLRDCFDRTAWKMMRLLSTSSTMELGCEIAGGRGCGTAETAFASLAKGWMGSNGCEGELRTNETASDNPHG